MNKKMGGLLKPEDFAGRTVSDPGFIEGCIPTYKLRMSNEAKKVSDRMFNGRTVTEVTKHAQDDGVTLLFADGMHGDVEACDAVEILKYLE